MPLLASFSHKVLQLSVWNALTPLLEPYGNLCFWLSWVSTLNPVKFQICWTHSIIWLKSVTSCQSEKIQTISSLQRGAKMGPRCKSDRRPCWTQQGGARWVLIETWGDGCVVPSWAVPLWLQFCTALDLIAKYSPLSFLLTFLYAGQGNKVKVSRSEKRKQK